MNPQVNDEKPSIELNDKKIYEYGGLRKIGKMTVATQAGTNPSSTDADQDSS